MNSSLMISIKNNQVFAKIATSGRLLAEIFEELSPLVVAGVSTHDLDMFIEKQLVRRQMVSGSKGYQGFRHVSCVSLNDEVVHGIPNAQRILHEGDLVKVDVCAAYQGWFADMARSFAVGSVNPEVQRLMVTACNALDSGIERAIVGNRLSDISAAIQYETEKAGFGVVRDFAGHGIGCSMHEEPEILNYGQPGKGPVLKEGMVFALEPMITVKDYRVYVDTDGWTVKTLDGSYAAHVEDTVIVTDDGPKIITRLNG